MWLIAVRGIGDGEAQGSERKGRWRDAEAAGWAAHARWTNSANHVSYSVLLLNIIDFTVVCGRWPAGAGVCRLRPSRAAHRLSSPPIEIYPPKTSPTQEWIIRFILRFRNFHLEGFECGSNDPVDFLSFVNICEGYVTQTRHL